MAERRNAAPSNFFGGGGKQKGMDLDSKIVSTVFPVDIPPNFFPLQLSKNSAITFASKDGKAQQWCIVCQNSFADVAANQFNGVVIEQQFNGAYSYIGCTQAIADGQPQVTLFVGVLPFGTVSIVGSIFRAFGDKIRIWPYASQAAPGKLSLAAAQVELNPYTQTILSLPGAATRIPYFATHVSVNAMGGNLTYKDITGVIISTVIAPVPGFYYPLPPEAFFIDDTAPPIGTPLRLVSFTIFG